MAEFNVFHVCLTSLLASYFIALYKHFVHAISKKTLFILASLIFFKYFSSLEISLPHKPNIPVDRHVLDFRPNMCIFIPNKLTEEGNRTLQHPRLLCGTLPLSYSVVIFLQYPNDKTHRDFFVTGKTE